MALAKRNALALKQLLQIGVENVLDDEIKPRELLKGKNVRIGEANAPFIPPELYEGYFVHNLVKIVWLCRNPADAKQLLLDQVKKRHNNTRLRQRVRLVREVTNFDLTAVLGQLKAAQRERDAAKVTDSPSRKRRATSPMDVEDSDTKKAKSYALDAEGMSHALSLFSSSSKIDGVVAKGSSKDSLDVADISRELLAVHSDSKAHAAADVAKSRKISPDSKMEVDNAASTRPSMEYLDLAGQPRNTTNPVPDSGTDPTRNEVSDAMAL